MTVLALDLATRAGWALHSSGDAAPKFGTLDLRDQPGQVGKAMETLRLAIGAIQREYGPLTMIVFEQQHLAGHGNLNSLKKLICLAGMVEWMAHCLSAECREVNIAQWRQHFLGKPAPRVKNGRRVSTWDRVTAKAAAIARCTAYGWDVEDSDDAAEALGILDFALALDADHVRPWRDQLLMGSIR
jgi:hypothetical protein